MGNIGNIILASVRKRIPISLNGTQYLPANYKFSLKDPYILEALPEGSIDKFVRFAEKIWKVESKNLTKDEIALAGIEKLSEFIKELGIPTTLREVGTTEDMLPKIANSSVILDGGYKKLTPDEILTILKEAY